MHAQHTLFLHFFAVVLRRLERETFRNFLVRVPVHFFSLSLIFTLHWWPLAFLILSPSLQNFHVVLQTKKSLLPFFISRSKSLSPFFSLSIAGLPPTISFSLALHSKFVDVRDNLSKLNTLDNTDTVTISSFRFRLYCLFCCL